MRVLLGAALLAAAALAAFASAGQAAVMRVGSDLTKTADTTEAHGADALFWNNSIDGAPGAMPADGQITFVRVKGSVLDSPALRRNPDPPDPMFHVQVLHPIGGGVVRVMFTSASFRLPIVTVLADGGVRGDTQAISGYTPVNLCVHKGDYVDFNDIGGHEWSWGGLDGMHFQIFSRTPNSSIYFYTKNAGTNNGSQWAPQELKQAQELLMQTTLSTGPDATDFCPGGFKQHVFTGLKVSSSGSLTMSDGTMKLRGSCDQQVYGACKGVLVISTPSGGRLVTVGGGTFSVNHGWSSSIRVRLSKANAALVKKAGGVVSVLADGHDDPRHDSRAKPDVPVQKKKTARRVQLKIS